MKPFPYDEPEKNALAATYLVALYQIACDRDPAWTWAWSFAGTAALLVLSSFAALLWPYRSALLELARRRLRRQH